MVDQAGRSMGLLPWIDTLLLPVLPPLLLASVAIKLAAVHCPPSHATYRCSPCGRCLSLTVTIALGHHCSLLFGPISQATGHVFASAEPTVLHGRTTAMVEPHLCALPIAAHPPLPAAIPPSSSLRSIAGCCLNHRHACPLLYLLPSSMDTISFLHRATTSFHGCRLSPPSPPDLHLIAAPRYWHACNHPATSLPSLSPRLPLASFLLAEIPLVAPS